MPINSVLLALLLSTALTASTSGWPKETNYIVEEQAFIVILWLTSERDVKRIHALEDKLSDAIRRTSTGEFDGDEFGKQTCTLYMYGPSAERLFDATIQILRDFHPPRGSYAVKRFGGPGSKQERIALPAHK